jgi:hypothetical protein
MAKHRLDESAVGVPIAVGGGDVLGRCSPGA